MQTFLPYPDFVKSAYVLDRQRLGKQRIEVTQILNALHDPTHGYRNHAAVKMWRGYTDALVAYGLAICEEWISQGYEDSQYDKILSFWSTDCFPLPLWFGRDIIHASHRGNLLRKDRRWYSVFHWTESPLLPYEWPVNIPLETLTELRRRGYEPISDGTSYSAANNMRKDKDVLVVGCNALFYPCRLARTTTKEGEVSTR